MGADVNETYDGMVINGGKPLVGANIDSYGDHRIAMAFSVAGLFAEGETVINKPECIAVSYPNFEIHLKELLSPNKRGLDEPITVIRSLSVEDDKN